MPKKITKKLDTEKCDKCGQDAESLWLSTDKHNQEIWICIDCLLKTEPELKDILLYFDTIKD